MKEAEFFVAFEEMRPERLKSEQQSVICLLEHVGRKQLLDYSVDLV